MAMAMEKSARGQPKSSATGIWNTPKLARMPKPTSKIAQLTTRTGVKSAGLGMSEFYNQRGMAKRLSVRGPFGRVNAHRVTRRITERDGHQPPEVSL